MFRQSWCNQPARVKAWVWVCWDMCASRCSEVGLQLGSVDTTTYWKMLSTSQNRHSPSEGSCLGNALTGVITSRMCIALSCEEAVPHFRPQPCCIGDWLYHGEGVCQALACSWTQASRSIMAAVRVGPCFSSEPVHCAGGLAVSASRYLLEYLYSWSERAVICVWTEVARRTKYSYQNILGGVSRG